MRRVNERRFCAKKCILSLSTFDMLFIVFWYCSDVMSLGKSSPCGSWPRYKSSVLALEIIGT